MFSLELALDVLTLQTLLQVLDLLPDLLLPVASVEENVIRVLDLAKALDIAICRYAEARNGSLSARTRISVISPAGLKLNSGSLWPISKDKCLKSRRCSFWDFVQNRNGPRCLIFRTA
jgi:hypothetical protein